jgi:hypothetical protein
MDALWRREDNSLSSTWCDMFSLKNIAVHFGRPHDWGVDFVAWQALAAIFGDSHGESYVAHGCHVGYVCRFAEGSQLRKGLTVGSR